MFFLLFTETIAFTDKCRVRSVLSVSHGESRQVYVLQGERTYDLQQGTETDVGWTVR